MKLIVLFFTVFSVGQTLLLNGPFHKIYSSVALAASVDTIWRHVRHFEKLGKVVLQDSNFDGITWYPGSSPKTIPARFNISLAGSSLTEEVYARDEINHVLSYKVVEPAMGIEFYQSTFTLKPITFCGHPATFLERTVDFRLSTGVPADSFNSLFESELLGFEVKFGTLHCTTAQNRRNFNDSEDSNNSTD